MPGRRSPIAVVRIAKKVLKRILIITTNVWKARYPVKGWSVMMEVSLGHSKTFASLK